MSSNIPIKIRAVGGFDRQQVDSYLDSLSAEYEQAASEQDTAALRAEIDELKAELREKDKKLDELKDTIASYSESENNKPDFGNITDSAKKFIDAHNEVVKIADDTSRYINSAERRLPSLLKSLSEISESVNHLKSELQELSEQIDTIPIAEKSDKDIFDIFSEEFEKSNNN